MIVQNLLNGKRVLITQADEFMGPVFCEVFAQQGAAVIASSRPLAEPDAAAQFVRDAAAGSSSSAAPRPCAA